MISVFGLESNFVVYSLLLSETPTRIPPRFFHCHKKYLLNNNLTLGVSRESRRVDVSCIYFRSSGVIGKTLFVKPSVAFFDPLYDPRDLLDDKL